MIESDASILAVLLRRRMLLVLAAVASIAVGAGVAKRTGGRHAAGAASVKLLLGTLNAPTITLDGVSPQTLMLKAPLLANHLATDDMRAAIARSAGLRPEELAVFVPAFRAARVAVPLATRASDAASVANALYALDIASDPQLPLVTVTAQAPTPAAASRLAGSAARAFRDLVASAPQGGKKRAGAQLLVQQLGRVEARPVVNKHTRIMAVVAALTAFGASCCTIVILSGLARARRRARASTDSPQLA